MPKKFNLAEFLPEDDAASSPMEITWVPLQKIDANWKNFYSVDINEQDLAESIEVSGLLTPLGVVRKDGGRFRLISGHRRLRALKYLHDSRPDGRYRWAEIPCVVYDSPADADREELMLIHANAQRIKTSQELATEARKLTEILVRMKEGGAELPGRMRDRVAEALQVSSTRLARLDAIEKNLTYPGWRQKWDDKKLGESVAYRLSQLDYSQQMNAADYVIDHHFADKDVTLKVIEDSLAHPPLFNPGCADPLAYEEDPVKVDRELVRRMDAMGYLSGMRFANRKDGMDQLKTTFRNWGHADGELDWDGDSKGIRFKKPVEWLIGWGALYDAMAANALDEAIERATTGTAGTGKDPSPPLRSAQGDSGAADPMEAPKVTVSAAYWHSCINDPPKGWMLVFLLDTWSAASHDYDLQVAQYHDGKWWGVYDACEEEIEVDLYSWWCPAPVIPAEVWEE